MRYKAVIFDLDGVLCFTDRYHFLAWKKLADRLNIPFDEDTNNRLRGVSRMKSLEIILEKSPVRYAEEEKALFAEEKNQTYRTLLQSMTPADVSAETRQTLAALRERNLKLAVGSSSKNAPVILALTDLGKYFDAVSDGNLIAHSKPDPEVFLKAAELLNADPADCLVVEDAEAGVQAGVNGGFDTAAIGDAAKTDCAKYRLSSLSDLLTVCG